MWFCGLMFEVGLYYIASHETTYCTPTPFFSDTVKCIAHGRIIRRIRYTRRLALTQVLERERETDRERVRQTGRQIGRQTDRKRERETDRWTCCGLPLVSNHQAVVHSVLSRVSAHLRASTHPPFFDNPI